MWYGMCELTAWHGRGTAWVWHAMWESVFNLAPTRLDGFHIMKYSRSSHSTYIPQPSLRERALVNYVHFITKTLSF